MQSSLKKSLYLGLAALSFASVAAVSTTASAKSYAKAGAYTTLSTKPETRNVEATGTNALYTKPGTVKGAKIVASKKVMGELATSKKSANYFRAYGQKTTNRGSVYYRVVTMDGKYRGYVYGGKTAGTFAGGVKSATTTTDATKPTKTTGYYLKDTTKNTIWTAPKYTQYKAKKVSLYGAKSTDTFTVDNAQTKTREGSLYYHVTDDNNSAITGWIYAGKGYDASITDNTKQDLGGLALNASDATATENNSVTVNYVSATNGNSIAKSTFVTKENGTKAGDDATSTTNANNKSLAQFATADVPAGYALSATQSTDNYTVANNAISTIVAKGAVYGGTFNVKVAKQATSKLQFLVSNGDGLTSTTVTASDIYGGMPNITTAQAAALTGLEGSSVTVDLSDYFTAGFDGANTLKATSATGDVYADDATAKTALAADPVTAPATATKAGDLYHVYYVYDKTATEAANTNAKFGDTLKVAFKTVNVLGEPQDTTTAAGSTNNY